MLLAVAEVATTGAQQAPGEASFGASIQVSASGEARAPADQAHVDLAVETLAPTARAAGEGNALAMERLIRGLRAAGVARAQIETRGYAVHPQYASPPRGSPEPQEPRITGYRASNSIVVRIDDVGRVGAVIDAGLEAGANRVNGVSFSLKNPEAIRAVALREAVQRARGEAQTLATALGVRLGALMEASTSGVPVRPMYRTESAVDFARAASTPIEPGEQTVFAQVHLV
ncbi:MAG: SIMPL domain-containing protein, partial [Gemmatimonadota bacterium]|nr:SIMPL domain-containing protein [Gemmatimonadota bacterium]